MTPQRVIASTRRSTRPATRGAPIQRESTRRVSSASFSCCAFCNHGLWPHRGVAGGNVPDAGALLVSEPALSHRQRLVRRLLPSVALAIATATGNMYSGLWYPITIVVASCLVGIVFVREARIVDLEAVGR
jgi:hypothetical protein